jgi:serine/threonine protein kinase
MSESGPKIIDFGIAQDLDATSVTMTGTVAGSPAWLSPEQIDGISLTPATDIFSVGSVLAFAATGESPWGNQSTTTSAVFNRILNKPPNLETLPEVQAKFIEDLLQKLPKDRPSAKQALATLKRELEGKIQETKVLPKPKPKPKAQTQVLKENTKTRTSPSPKLERPKRIAKVSPFRTQSKKTKLTILLSLLVVPLGLIAAAASGSVGNFVSSIVGNSAAEKQESPIMPDFTGKSVDEVTDFLTSVGITKWSEVSIDSAVEKGLVGGTIPEPGVEIDVDFWNSSENTFQILVSAGVMAESFSPTSPSAALQGVNTMISWTGINLDDENSMGENGSWAFYTPTIADGVLQVLVFAEFEEDTTILLGTNCSYLVDGATRLGCYSSLPSKIAASANRYIDPIPFDLNIGAAGIDKPETFTVSLYIEDSKGIRNVKLNFVVGFWGNEEPTG